MDTPFLYRRIGPLFHMELAELVSRGQSAVLLGLRLTGKRLLLKILAEKLLATPDLVVFQVEFARQPALAELSAVKEVMEAVVHKAAPTLTLRKVADDELLGSVQQICDEHHYSVVLLVSNLDSIAHHVAQKFLREVRVLVENHRLTAVLTGEENLGLLVHGSDSEFNCAHQFIIQGFEEAEFLNYMRHRGEVASIRFANETDCLRELFVQTQGNILFARAALWAWHNMRSRGLEPKDKLEDTSFFEFIKCFPETDDSGTNVFHNTVRLVERAFEEWKDLESLLENGTTPGSLTAVPSSLELAGLAVRDGGMLRFASPIVRRFAEKYYDPCRLGDLYTSQGKWKEAFLFYERMPMERRLRPSGVADRHRVASAINALVAKLHSEATCQGEASLARLEIVKDYFVRGCRLVLGVSEVTFWTHCGEWKPLQGQHIDDPVNAFGCQILKRADRNKFGWQDIESPMNLNAALAVLPSVRPDCRDAVILSYVN